MDPKAAWDLATDESQEPADRLDALVAVREWVLKGGFAPEGYSEEAVDSVLLGVLVAGV